MIARLIPVIVLITSVHSVFASERVPDYYQKVGQKFSIPASLLYAIAQQESMPPASMMTGQAKPWPWTLNCEGHAYYLATQHDAATIAAQYIGRGKNCDIGLMQISWRYHKSELSSIDAALEPLTNLKIGAGYLKSLYQKSQSWVYAVGTYHSRNPVKANNYVRHVSRHLSRILGVRF